MTTAQKNYIRTNWMTLANLIMLVSLTVKISMWAQKTDDEIKQLNSHTQNQDLHMPFDKKIQIFVPRVELENRFISISAQLDRIEDKLDKN